MPSFIDDFIALFPTEDEATIRARWDAWANEGLTEENVDSWTDVREGAFFHVCTQPGVREAARIYDLMGTEVPASRMPMWTWGEYLDDEAEVQGLARLAATYADGEATFAGDVGEVISAGVTIAVEAVEDQETPEYEVVTGGTIPGQAVAPTGLAAAAVVGGGSFAAGTYGWKVTAVDAAGETTGSLEDTEAIALNGSASLTWDPVATATSYRVYRGASGGPWLLVGEADTPAFTDTGIAGTDAVPVANTTGGKITLPIRALTAGSLGNVSAGAIEVVQTPLPGVTVTNEGIVTGGTDTETDEPLRERVLERYAGAAAANALYYRRLARDYPGVGRAVVVAVWDGPGTVLVIIADAEGEPVSAATVLGLQNQLDPTPGTGDGLGQVGATITVLSSAIQAVKVDATVEFEDGYSLDGGGGTIALRESIEAVIEAYVDSVEPGGEVVRQQIIGRIVSVRGVHDVGDVELDDTSANVAVPDSPVPMMPTATPINLVEGDV